MGIIQSKTKRPHEILGVATTATLGEVRAKYVSLASKSNSPSVTSAYNSIMDNPPLIEEYTEDLVVQDLNKYADDVYERVSKYTGTYIPVFSKDPDGVFRVCLGFRGDPSRFPTLQEYTAFCFKVVKFTGIVRKIYMRSTLPNEETVCEAKESTEKDTRSFSEKEYVCDDCCKGFRSVNHLINHFKSKKHFSKIQSKHENPNEVIQQQIGKFSVEDPVQEIFIEEVRDAPCQVQEVPVVVKVPAMHVEQKIFRTCSYCDMVFETRGNLLVHLRNEHKGEK